MGTDAANISAPQQTAAAKAESAIKRTATGIGTRGAAGAGGCQVAAG